MTRLPKLYIQYASQIKRNVGELDLLDAVVMRMKSVLKYT